MCVFLVTQLIASIMAGGIIGALEPAKGITLTQTGEDVEITAVSFNILAQLTVGDFVNLWSRSNLLALVVFAVLTGFGIRAAGEAAAPIRKIINSANAVVVKMVSIIMELAPVCLGCYVAATIGQYGSDITGPMGKMVLVTFIYSIIYFIVVQSIYSFIGGGAAGLKRYWTSIAGPALTALGTCSSAAAIPANVEAAKKAGISEDVSSLVMPMGCNLHKEGACLIVVITISLECSLLGWNIFDPGIFMMMIAAAMLGSMITGAIPSGGNVIIMLVVSMFGFPAEHVPLIILLHTLVDAPTTTLNVVGDLSSAQIIDNIVRKINKKAA